MMNWSFTTYGKRHGLQSHNPRQALTWIQSQRHSWARCWHQSAGVGRGPATKAKTTSKIHVLSDRYALRLYWFTAKCKSIGKAGKTQNSKSIENHKQRSEWIAEMTKWQFRRCIILSGSQMPEPSFCPCLHLKHKICLKIWYLSTNTTTHQVTHQPLKHLEVMSNTKVEITTGKHLASLTVQLTVRSF